MTPGHSDAEITSLDAYITGQLALASAELARHTDTEARLQAVLQQRRHSAQQAKPVADRGER